MSRFSTFRAMQGCWLLCSCRASVRHKNAICLSLPFHRQVANSRYLLSGQTSCQSFSFAFQVCLYIRILRGCPPTKTVLPTFIFCRWDFPNSYNPGRIVFVARSPICNYIFTSIAENRYSHSYSKPCYSYSRTRTLHSPHYSHYR